MPAAAALIAIRVAVHDARACAQQPAWRDLIAGAAQFAGHVGRNLDAVE